MTRSAAPAVPAVGVARVRGRRLRPGRARRRCRRLRNEHDQRLPAAQPDVEPRSERDHRTGRQLRHGQPVAAERQGLPRPRRWPTSSTCAGPRCRCRRPARRRWSRCTWPARASSTASATSRWPAARRCGSRTGSVTGTTRVDGVADGPLPAVRRPLRRHDLRQRGRRGRPQGVRRRGRRRRPHPRRDPRIGGQQRRFDQDDLRCAQRRRPGRRDRRGARGGRRRREHRQLHRDPRHRHAAGRSDRSRGAASGVRGLRARPAAAPAISARSSPTSDTSNPPPAWPG